MGVSSVISNGARNPCLERSEGSFGLRQERISPAGRNDRKNGRKDNARLPIKSENSVMNDDTKTIHSV